MAKWYERPDSILRFNEKQHTMKSPEQVPENVYPTGSQFSQIMNATPCQFTRSWTTTVSPKATKLRMSCHTPLHSSRKKLKLMASRAMLVCFGALIVICTGCVSPVKRAQQDADYRTHFEQSCSIKLTEIPNGKNEVAGHQFLPGAKVEVRVNHFNHGEKLSLKIERENGQAVAVSDLLELRPVAKLSQPQVAYPILLVQTPGGGLREELHPLYYARGDSSLMDLTGPNKPLGAGKVEWWSRFHCPQEPGNYQIVLDRIDRSDMQRLKTFQFSVVRTLPHEESLDGPTKN
jgi:hypothetical protein